MADPFGDKDQGSGGASRRPAQTIDGTATEVGVEPAPEQEAAAAAPEHEDGPDVPARAPAAVSPRPLRRRERACPKSRAS